MFRKNILGEKLSIKEKMQRMKTEIYLNFHNLSPNYFQYNENDRYVDEIKEKITLKEIVLCDLILNENLDQYLKGYKKFMKKHESSSFRRRGIGSHFDLGWFEFSEDDKLRELFEYGRIHYRRINHMYSIVYFVLEPSEQIKEDFENLYKKPMEKSEYIELKPRYLKSERKFRAFGSYYNPFILKKMKVHNFFGEMKCLLTKEFKKYFPLLLARNGENMPSIEILGQNRISTTLGVDEALSVLGIERNRSHIHDLFLNGRIEFFYDISKESKNNNSFKILVNEIDSKNNDVLYDISIFVEELIEDIIPLVTYYEFSKLLSNKITKQVSYFYKHISNKKKFKRFFKNFLNFEKSIFELTRIQKKLVINQFNELRSISKGYYAKNASNSKKTGSFTHIFIKEIEHFCNMNEEKISMFYESFDRIQNLTTIIINKKLQRMAIVVSITAILVAVMIFMFPLKPIQDKIDNIISQLENSQKK